MADGLMVFDPDKSWKSMKRAGKPLFDALGELRDTQVMEELVQKIGAADDPVTNRILDHAKGCEHELKAKSLAELDKFDRKAWRGWSKQLPRRAARIRPGSLVFRHLALEKWNQARELQRQALRNRSQVGLHRLRIGLKRFRYIVENFLPELHDAWISDLKELQDLLGEVHDLDVLWNKMAELKAFPDVESRTRWRGLVTEERTKRINQYREKMLGKDTLWNSWRGALPKDEEVRQAGYERMRIWASFLDPDVHQSQHVGRLALKLYDGLIRSNGLRMPEYERTRDVLRAASVMYEVGKAKSKKGHHKKSSKLIGKVGVPFGWASEDLALAAAVARYHRGALPQGRQPELVRLSTDKRKIAVNLAAVLRLANAFGCDGRESIQDLEVRPADKTLTILAKGYSPRNKMAENIAAARHLLELVANRPVMVRRMQ
jgi:exopolyphosphatase/guanosine-5'-triphosphate,3'-diphosphate pyrophosphatase